MPKIRVGWVGLVWDTMARQTRAKKVTPYLQHYSRCTKLHLHKKELESIWSIQLLGPERERALHWRYFSKCIRFLGPIHSVFCTLYKKKKKTCIHLGGSKASGYPAIRHEEPSTFPLEPQNDWTRSCAHPFPQPGHICILHTTFVLLTPTQALRTFSHS